jgi:hypothetical protein
LRCSGNRARCRVTGVRVGGNTAAAAPWLRRAGTPAGCAILPRYDPGNRKHADRAGRLSSPPAPDPMSHPLVPLHLRGLCHAEIVSVRNRPAPKKTHESGRHHAETCHAATGPRSSSKPVEQPFPCWGVLTIAFTLLSPQFPQEGSDANFHAAHTLQAQGPTGREGTNPSSGVSCSIPRDQKVRARIPPPRHVEADRRSRAGIESRFRFAVALPRRPPAACQRGSRPQGLASPCGRAGGHRRQPEPGRPRRPCPDVP